VTGTGARKTYPSLLCSSIRWGIEPSTSRLQVEDHFATGFRQTWVSEKPNLVFWWFVGFLLLFGFCGLFWTSSACYQL